MAIKKEPSLKQKELAKKVMENYGNVSKSMKEVGYSESSAKNPQIITNTKGFQEAMKPFTEKLRQHREQIIDRMITEVGNARYNELSGAITNIDKILRLDAGKPTEKIEINNIEKLTNDQLKEIIAKGESGNGGESTGE